MKLDITLRLLAGRDPLDVAVIFDIALCHYKTIMYYVIKEWIIPLKVDDVSISSYLKDEEATLE